METFPRVPHSVKMSVRPPNPEGFRKIRPKMPKNPKKPLKMPENPLFGLFLTIFYGKLQDLGVSDTFLRFVVPSEVFPLFLEAYKSYFMQKIRASGPQ